MFDALRPPFHVRARLTGRPAPSTLQMSLASLNDAMPATFDEVASLNAAVTEIEGLIGYERRPAGSARRRAPQDVEVPSPAGWAPEILATRTRLHHPAATAELDARVTAICADPATPTPSELVRLARMLDGASLRGRGDLDAGLRHQAARASRPRAVVFVSRQEAASLLRTVIEVKRQRSALVAGHPLVDGNLRARKRLDTTIRRDLLPMLRRADRAGLDRQIGMRNRLDGHWAEWEVALGRAR